MHSASQAHSNKPDQNSVQPQSSQIRPIAQVNGFEYRFEGVPVVFPYDAYDVQVCILAVADHAHVCRTLNFFLRAEAIHGVCYQGPSRGTTIAEHVPANTGKRRWHTPLNS